MAAITLKRMKDTLAKLEAEHEQRAKRIEAFRHVIAYYEENGEDAESLTTPSTEMDEAMEAILESKGKPLHRTEIYNRLQEGGMRVGGQDPLSNVSAHLSLGDKFKSLGEGNWGLVRWGIITRDSEVLEDEFGQPVARITPLP